MYYPFKVLSNHNITELELDSITILYGGNGCGKSTALNIISEKLGLSRDSLYNRTDFFDDYLRLCDYEETKCIPKQSRIITSDDVFDYMLNLRSINDGIDSKRGELFKEYQDTVNKTVIMRSLDDYDELRKNVDLKRKSKSQYVRENLNKNIREYSNGESSILYFREKIKENALYILDEPENSLSAENQIELQKFISDSARFFGCQFIIATHSPFLLSMKGALVYDFEGENVETKKWTELSSVKAYYEFFTEHRKEFEEI